jgi:hypothetical protein
MWRSRHRQWIDKWAEETRQRHEEWLTEWRERVAREAKEQKRRFDKIDADTENDKRVTRESILMIREEREKARRHHVDLMDEMRAQRQGLLRMLDRLDGKDGPEPRAA